VSLREYVERVRGLPVAVCLVAAAAAACSDDEGGGGGAVEAAFAKVTGAVDVTVAVRSGATVRIPAGAVDRTITVRLEQPAVETARTLLGRLTTLNSTYSAASAPYIVTPHRQQFSKQVEIELPIASGRSAKAVRMAWLEDENDTSWELLDPPEIVGERARVKLTHFSVLALVDIGEDGAVPGPGLDAGPDAAVGDAGMDANLSDAGAPDAGAVDADTRDTARDAIVSEAATPDAGPLRPTTTDELSAFIRQRLTECQLATQAGDLGRFRLRPNRECEAACLVNAQCSDLAGALCGGPVSEAFEVCYDDCAGKKHTYGLCPSTTQLAVFCDGEATCESSEDEYTCDASQLFTCTSGQNVGKNEACDGYRDCDDGSDELGCPDNLYFLCASGGERVHPRSKCDGNADCSDASDEVGCASSIHFVCTNGEKVSANVVCDGYDDCLDRADELDCAGKTFTCGSGEIIHLDFVCDLQADCRDASDEPTRCLKLTCQSLVSQ